jgi:hypothetical protein
MLTRFFVAAFLALGLSAAACPEGNDMSPREPRSTNLPRPRDPNIAVQEELDAARRAGTLAVYDLFLARHGDHPLAETARRERALIAARAAQ